MITIKNLSFGYNSKEEIIHDVSLHVQPGTIYGFLGPNGSGKTTIIRLILNLLKHKSGKILIDGTEVNINSVEIFRRIGSMIESPSLYNHLSGRANLEIFALYYSIDKKRIEEVLEIVGLTESAHKIVKRYSLGMKQRLGIAICLLHDPDLLILDEPLNGLDPHGIAEIRHLLIKLCKEEGKTIFVSSHLLSEIESTCDFIGIISKGKLLFQGKIDDLKNAQAGKMVYSLETSNVDLTMLQLNQMNGLTCSTFDNKITVEVENKEEIAQVVKSLVTNGVDLYSVERKENNLEDLFLELTK